jgi:hypothetical protein
MRRWLWKDSLALVRIHVSKLWPPAQSSVSMSLVGRNVGTGRRQRQLSASTFENNSLKWTDGRRGGCRIRRGRSKHATAETTHQHIKGEKMDDSLAQETSDRFLSINNPSDQSCSKHYPTIQSQQKNKAKAVNDPMNTKTPSSHSPKIITKGVWH